jgi:hypothetical protein
MKMNRYVLEGNRRVAALKLLLNPDGAPEKYKGKFRSLSRSLDRPLLKKVQAVVAPSREAATPIIIEKHTHTTIKPWSVLMQAGYVGNIVENHPEEMEKLKEMKIRSIHLTIAVAFFASIRQRLPFLDSIIRFS